MKGVEIHFALCTPGRSIKAQCCSDGLIEEVMEAIWRPPDDHLWMRLSVCLLTVLSGNVETGLGKSFGTAGNLLLLSVTPYLCTFLHNRARRHNNCCQIAGHWTHHLTLPIMSGNHLLFTIICTKRKNFRECSSLNLSKTKGAALFHWKKGLLLKTVFVLNWQTNLCFLNFRINNISWH